MKKCTYAVAGSSLLLLAACANPNDGYQNTRTGAGLGAAMGGALGALVSDGSAKGAVVGAVAGGMAGAAYGNYLDKQAAQLQSSLGDNADVRVANNQLTVSMNNDILFATDSSSLSPVARGDLNTIAQSLQQYPNSNIKVIGYTDNTGDAQYNQVLSMKRATTVANQLVSSGVPASRIQASGMGEDSPIATNLTAEGRAQNRRVNIVIVPTQPANY